MMKSLLLAVLLMISFVSLNSHAAVREGGGGDPKIINKLQTMVKEVTSERDLLKTEKDKLATELEQAKKELSTLKEEKTAAQSVEQQLSGELAAQKSSADQTSQHLEATTAKLHEVIDKYNALNKSKNEQTSELMQLQNNHQATAVELKACESKNSKMAQAGKEIIAGYKSCQNRDVVDALMQSEPVLQINTVEVETIIQEYEDKLRKQEYQAPATK